MTNNQSPQAQHRGQTIAVTAGGTGGHVFPALAVADLLRDQGCDVHWFGTQKGIEARIVPEHQFPLHLIDIGGLRGKGRLAQLFAPLRILKATWQAIRLLKVIKPVGLLGMGGYVTGPVGVAAWVLRIPVVIHEQNAVAGMTNRLLARISQRVFTAFPEAFSGDQKLASKVVLAGNPVRSAIAKIPPPDVRLQGRKGPIRILVVGGSLGALAINQVLPPALEILLSPTSNTDITDKVGSKAESDAEYEINEANGSASLEIDLWHQCGEKHLEATCEAYGERQNRFKIEPFIDNMAAAYEWADLIICRAGALTVSEVAAVGLPALFIPFPFAVDDHQTVNARSLVEQNAAFMVQQSELTPEKLVSLLKPLLIDRERLRVMSLRSRALGKPAATQHVTEQFLEVCQ